MRAVLILCACATVVCGQNADTNRMARMPKYDERYDYLDVDALFTSKRLVRNYVDCLISAQRCTPEGKQLKRILPEALRTKCIRCTERQKKAAVKVIRRLKNDFPEEWAKLASRWDPTGDFTRYFEEFLANENFNTISGSAVSNEVAGLSSIPPIPLVPARLPAGLPPSAGPVSTSPRPIILNRFGDEGELMLGSPSSANVTPRPTTARPALSPTTARPPPPPPPPRPTQTSWVPASSDAMTTRFPLRPTNDLPLPYTTAITFIDQIGYKIIRTTELVTDILKNTVRAVVGR